MRHQSAALVRTKLEISKPKSEKTQLSTETARADSGAWFKVVLWPVTKVAFRGAKADTKTRGPRPQTP